MGFPTMADMSAELDEVTVEPVKNFPPADKQRTRETILQAITEINHPTTVNEIAEHLYGEITSTHRNRVAFHVRSLVDQKIIGATGVNQNRRYYPPGVPVPSEAKKSKAPTPRAQVTQVQLGAVFETVGVIGKHAVVRSLDTSELYKLEKL